MLKKILIASMLCLSASQLFPEQDSRGSLVIIGGGLAAAKTRVYQQWIDLAGGRERMRLAIIPAASATPASSGKYVADDFIRLGVAAERIKVFPVALVDEPDTKETDESRWQKNGFDPLLAKEMAGYNSVFFVGGDQIRTLKTLVDATGRDSPLLAAIRDIYEHGGVLGGTSAGAAIMSNPMICDGNSQEAVSEGAVYLPGDCATTPGVRLTRGLGFFADGLVDQHCLKRGRFGRLIVALLFLKDPAVGFGVDEDTALVVHDHTLQVVGSSGVLMVDTRQARGGQTPLGWKAENVILHYLSDGDSYNPETGVFTIVQDKKPIKKGDEENETYPLNTNIFGRDSLVDSLTSGLADNRQNRSEGMSFLLEKDGTGRGIFMTLRKEDGTVGYYGERDDRDLYSVLNVHLDMSPLKVRVEIQK